MDAPKQMKSNVPIKLNDSSDFSSFYLPVIVWSGLQEKSGESKHGRHECDANRRAETVHRSAVDGCHGWAPKAWRIVLDSDLSLDLHTLALLVA